LSIGYANQVVSAEPLGSSELTARRNLSLDGLRGIAVLLVLLHHHGFMNAGWMGVDLFFVLSGYLITSILRRTRTDKFFWREFWTKRFTRILPPFLLLLLMTSLLGFSSSWLQVLGYLTSFGDVLAYVRPTFQPLRQLWSLAVEEHFYIIWPFAVRLLPRRSLVFILVSLVAVEPVVRGIASVFFHNWDFVYFLTPFRLDGLALGSLLSLGLESPRDTDLIRKWSGLATVLFVIMWFVLRLSLGLRFTRDNPTAIYNGACYSLVSLVASSLIAYLISHPRSIVVRLLAWKPLVFTGVISYGLYLYQVLVMEMLIRKWHIPAEMVFWIDTPIIFLLAWLSFAFYERPLIRWGKTKSASRVV
jgi:peptidoglycan/LPS O-acetylase OafA/YrhL